jgi:3-oxoacyl-[acyl-carrier-protein] synthase-3
MDAQGVMKVASHAIPICVDCLMKSNGLTANSINIVIPHQLSISLLRNVADKTGVPFSKFRTNMDHYTNTAGATIPIVLHETKVEQIRRRELARSD